MLNIAQRCTNADGVKFDSKTEMHFYAALTAMGVEFKFQVKEVLMGPAVHRPQSQKLRDQNPLLRDRGIESICLTIDFVFERGGVTYYVDTKGSKQHVKRDSKLRYEIWKRILFIRGDAPTSRILFISAAEVKTLGERAAYLKSEFWQVFDQIKER